MDEFDYAPPKYDPEPEPESQYKNHAVKVRLTLEFTLDLNQGNYHAVYEEDGEEIRNLEPEEMAALTPQDMLTQEYRYLAGGEFDFDDFIPEAYSFFNNTGNKATLELVEEPKAE